MRRPRSAGNLNVRINRIGRAIRREVLRELKRGGLRIENTAAESIIEQTPGGRPYPSRGKKGAVHYASPPGSPPNADTGELHTGITTVTVANTPSLIRVQTGTNSPYAEPLEFGTSKMEPRPFMEPAFNQHVHEIEARVRAAIRRGIRNGGR